MKNESAERAFLQSEVGKAGRMQNAGSGLRVRGGGEARLEGRA